MSDEKDNRTVTSAEVGSAVSDVLYRYSNDIQYGVRELTDESADELKKLISQNSPVDKRKTRRRGKYKKSWRVKVTTDKFTVYEKTVCSEKEYRLTHLLEKPHVKRGGGITTPQPHIAPAAEKVKKSYVEKINEIVKTSRRYGGGRYNYNTKKYE